MTTRNIVPQNDGEGTIGKSIRRWNGIFVNKINDVPVEDVISGFKVIDTNFVGNGSEVTIPHLVGRRPAAVNFVATSNPNGELGDTWVRFDETNVYIGNTGTFTGGCKVYIEKGIVA